MVMVGVDVVVQGRRAEKARELKVGGRGPHGVGAELIQNPLFLGSICLFLFVRSPFILFWINILTEGVNKT